MSFDYSFMYKEVLARSGMIGGDWDVFVSAYNLSDRVKDVYDRVVASRKLWVIHPEYELGASLLPGGEQFLDPGSGEAEFCNQLLSVLPMGEEGRLKMCVDITGMMRPHMMCLLFRLADLGVSKVDVLYSEPITYAGRETTKFSSGALEVRQVAVLEGMVAFDSSSDLMVIGAGFDDRQISEVAEHMDAARKVILLGFPPLRADMYQQNLLRMDRSRYAMGDVPRSWRYFAPASDPFATAEVLRRIVDGNQNVSNLYLAPLSTKAQALGFVLYYMAECRDRPAHVIYPFSAQYEGRTTEGLARTWKYVVEFDALR